MSEDQHEEQPEEQHENIAATVLANLIDDDDFDQSDDDPFSIAEGFVDQIREYVDEQIDGVSQQDAIAAAKAAQRAGMYLGMALADPSKRDHYKRLIQQERGIIESIFAQRGIDAQADFEKIAWDITKRLVTLVL